MKKKKFFSILIIIFMLFTCCDGVNNIISEAKSKTPKLVITTPTSSSTYTYTKTTSKYEQFNLKYKITNGKKKAVTFTSSNKKVATIDKKGKVTIKKAGNTNIKVTAKLKTGKKVTDSLKLKVVNSKVEIISPTNKDTYNYFRAPSSGNEYFNIKYVTSNVTKKSVSYSSTKPDVASVDLNGKVTVKKAGITTIKVIITMTNGKKVSDNLKVVVGNAEVKFAYPTSADTYNYVKTTNSNEIIKWTYKLLNCTGKSIEYTSSNTDVATINNSGVMTVKKAGTTYIKIIATISTGKKISKLVKVTIKEDISIIGTEEDVSKGCLPFLHIWGDSYIKKGDYVPPVYVTEDYIQNVAISTTICNTCNKMCIHPYHEGYTENGITQADFDKLVKIVEENGGYITDFYGRTYEVLFESMVMHRENGCPCYGESSDTVKTGTQKEATRTYLQCRGYYEQYEYQDCKICGQTQCLGEAERLYDDLSLYE